jgi:hypothetical protein
MNTCDKHVDIDVKLSDLWNNLVKPGDTPTASTCVKPKHVINHNGCATKPIEPYKICKKNVVLNKHKTRNTRRDTSKNVTLCFICKMDLRFLWNDDDVCKDCDKINADHKGCHADHKENNNGIPILCETCINKPRQYSMCNICSIR